jgi:hypothetical protein
VVIVVEGLVRSDPRLLGAGDPDAGAAEADSAAGVEVGDGDQAGVALDRQAPRLEAERGEHVLGRAEAVESRARTQTRSSAKPTIANGGRSVLWATNRGWRSTRQPSASPKPATSRSSGSLTKTPLTTVIDTEDAVASD